MLADSINRLRRGQLDPRVANAMGYLASVLLKALDQKLEERLAHLEAVISGKGENLLARAAALTTFGTEKEVQAAMEQTFLLFKSNFGEAKTKVPASNLSTV